MRGCTDQIFTLCLILQQCKYYNLPTIDVFLHFVAAFNSVTYENHWQIMVEDGMLVDFRAAESLL